MVGTLRIVRTGADENPTREDVVDLRGRVPWPCQGEGREFESRHPLESNTWSAAPSGAADLVFGQPLYHFALPFLPGCLCGGAWECLGRTCCGSKRAAVGVMSAATDDVSSAAPRLRPKGPVASSDAGTIELAPRSVLTRRSAANTMCATARLDGRMLGAVQLHKLTWREIEEMYGAMRTRGATTSWVRRCATVLSTSLEFARKRELIDSNPSKDATRPRTNRAKPISPKSDAVCMTSIFGY
jgi:hypothetical protein